jgi:hypothetical protein
MPLEIRELVIRVTVNEQAASQLTEAMLAKKLQELEARVLNQCQEKLQEQLEKMHER